MDKVIEQLRRYIPGYKLRNALKALLEGELIKAGGITFVLVGGNLYYHKDYEIVKVIRKWKEAKNGMIFTPEYFEKLKNQFIFEDFRHLPELSLTDQEIEKILDKRNPVLRLLRYKGLPAGEDIIDCCVCFEDYVNCLKWIKKWIEKKRRKS